MRRPIAGVLVLLASTAASGSDFQGQVEILGATFPARDVKEARFRVFGRYERALGGHWFVVASGAAEGLLGREEDAFFRLQDTYVERRSDRFELRIGASNVVWGVLDEIQPEDVVNSLDVARFVLDGRAEGRLPALLSRLRVFVSQDVSIEAVLVPFPRRGRFDALGEDTSPFAPEGSRALPRSRLPRASRNVEFGVRTRGTFERVDWGVSFYRDVVDFDRYALSPSGLVASRPVRFMLGGDFETPRGDWVFRGEGAFFFRDPVQRDGPPGIERHTSFQGGVGADRRMGDATLFLNALYQRAPGTATPDEVSVVFGLSGTFSRGTRTAKAFGIYNARSESAFLRTVFSQEVVENLRLEGEAGVFLGEGGLALGLLSDSDFVLARLRVYF